MLMRHTTPRDFMTAEAKRALGLAAAIAGVVLLAIAIVYFAVPAKSLPGFMGQISGATVHRNKRGVAALVLAAIAFVVAAIMLARRGRPGGDADRAGGSGR
jgi:hypothetical protein